MWDGLLNAARFDAGFDKMQGSKVPYHVLILMFICTCLWSWLIEHTICRLKGHAWEDTGSFANRDSGADDLTCTRCGYNFHHIYY